MSKWSVVIEGLSIYEKINKDASEELSNMISQFNFSINWKSLSILN